MIETIQNGEVLPSEINGGRALELNSNASLPDLLITVRNAQVGENGLFRIRLAGVKTIEDVEGAIIGQTLSKGTSQVVAFRRGDRLVVQDLSLFGGLKGTQTFRVQAAEGSFAGVPGIGIGIAGSDDDGDGIIEGHPLHGDSIVDHLFLRGVRIEGSLKVDASSIEASARFLALGIGVQNGTGTLSASAALDLLDPGAGAAQDGRIFLSELANALGAPRSIVLRGVVPADGVISGITLIRVGLGLDPPVSIELSSDPSNRSPQDLVEDLNLLINRSGIGAKLRAAWTEEGLTLALIGDAVPFAHLEFSTRQSSSLARSILPQTLSIPGRLIQATFTGSAAFALPVFMRPAVLGAVLGSKARLLVTWTDLTQFSTLKVTPEGFDIAGGLANLAVDLSQRELNRLADLFKAGVIAASEFDRARLSHERNARAIEEPAAQLATARLGGRADAIASAEAEVAAATAVRERADWAVAQKIQSAPSAALVHDTLFREGEFVPAGTPVVALLPPENLKVRFFVPEAAFAVLKAGDRVRVTITGRATPLEARVNYLSTRPEFTPPVLYNRDNRAKLVFMVEAALDPAVARDLHPGQPVDVVLASRAGL